jgi:hypothetical protein
MNRPTTPSALECLRRAIDKSGIPDKAIADELGVSKGQCSKLLNATAGSSGFPLDALDLLPRSVTDEFLRLYGATRNLRIERQDELQAALLKAMEGLTDVIAALKVRTDRK